MVTEQDSEQGEGLTELSDELEEELCKVWDMAMDKVRYTISHLTLCVCVCTYIIQYLNCGRILCIFYAHHMNTVTCLFGYCSKTRCYMHGFYL